jgi:hypothetical protein
MLVLTPVAAAGAAGLWALYRRGRRVESVTAAAVIAASWLWNAGLLYPYGGPFGGTSPGPRYLIGTLPFLALGLGEAWRRAPYSTGALALVSAGWMAVVTGTTPLHTDISDWLGWVASGEFGETALTLAGTSNRTLAVLPFFALLVVAACAAVRTASPPRPGALTLVAPAACLTAWAVVAVVGKLLLDHDLVGSSAAIGLAVVTIATCAALAARLETPRPNGLSPNRASPAEASAATSRSRGRA